jgi:hypothetical protein
VVTEALASLAVCLTDGGRFVDGKVVEDFYIEARVRGEEREEKENLSRASSGPVLGSR